jgi:hypothetical protein
MNASEEHQPITGLIITSENLKADGDFKFVEKVI